MTGVVDVDARHDLSIILESIMPFIISQSSSRESRDVIIVELLVSIMTGEHNVGDRITELEEMELCVQALINIALTTEDAESVRIALGTLLKVRSGKTQLEENNVFTRQ